MIKFFRHIRRSLINQDQMGKPPSAKASAGRYFKYAIGEILLVVIGILIALQINNWNEGKKRTKVEMGILDEIRSSLQIDLEEIDRESGYIQRNFKSQNIIINWIESKEPFNDSLSKHLHNVNMAALFRYQSSSYETLKQLGMNTIRNDSLRKRISLLYDYRYEDHLVKMSSRRSLLRKVLERNPFHFNESIGIDENVTKPLDIDELRKDNTYLFHLKTLNNYDELLLTRLIPTIKKQIEKTKVKIEEEIKNRGQ